MLNDEYGYNDGIFVFNIYVGWGIDLTASTKHTYIKRFYFVFYGLL